MARVPADNARPVMRPVVVLIESPLGKPVAMNFVGV